MRKFGPLRVDAVKSTINLVSKYHFGGIAVRTSYLRLGFLSDRAIAHPRVVRTERAGTSKVVNYVLLRSPRDVNRELVGWLRQAHQMQSE